MAEVVMFGDEQMNDLDLVRRIVLGRLREAPIGTAESAASLKSAYSNYVNFPSDKAPNPVP